jgi:hypothetical protein
MSKDIQHNVDIMSPLLEQKTSSEVSLSYTYRDKEDVMLPLKILWFSAPCFFGGFSATACTYFWGCEHPTSMHE